MVSRWSFRPLVLFELQTPDFALKLVRIVSANFDQNANLQRYKKNEKNTKITKQDQGSKAPSRDHPNNSFMTRLDYIRVED